MTDMKTSDASPLFIERLPEQDFYSMPARKRHII
jgi:hypothetical protein